MKFTRTKQQSLVLTVSLAVAFSFGLGIVTPFFTSNTVQATAVSYRAVNEQISASLLNQFQGTWYNHQGQAMLDIQNGYINSTQVVGMYDYVGSTKLKVMPLFACKKKMA
ncbi:hypothetical protein [uncultured Veillonella sp.]|uniref:hypothetical protein n=1 Tax=uncultured Veillonella sp. TaxID=159268 RepID=UPI0025F631A4|nr:hypothetical protein [uncultured Veillonella sp.]